MQIEASPNIHNGTYTVSHSKQGHFTVKLYTVKQGNLAGKRIIAILAGADNVSDYRGVAFWDDEKKTAAVWRRYRGPESKLPINGYHWQKTGWSSVERKLAVWSDLAIRGDGTGEDGSKGFWAGEGYRLLLAAHCLIYNRKLTEPESIRTGFGPVCGRRS